MKRKIIVLLVVSLLSTFNGRAQEDDTAPDEKPVPSQQETAGPETTPEQVRPNEQFVPSETISEDLSVPFPVDI